MPATEIHLYEEIKQQSSIALDSVQVETLTSKLGMLKEEAVVALTHLHDLGLVYYSPKFIQDVIISDPQWIVKALTCVITAQKTHFIQNGVFSKSARSIIWSSYLDI